MPYEGHDLVNQIGRKLGLFSPFGLTNPARIGMYHLAKVGGKPLHTISLFDVNNKHLALNRGYFPFQNSPTASFTKTF